MILMQYNALEHMLFTRSM